MMTVSMSVAQREETLEPPDITIYMRVEPWAQFAPTADAS